jgi:DNA helicase-2/ATP-dependent DNA helicase PcrA
VLTERARHLLRHWHLPAGAVTLVAFNKKAAVEMRERTPDLPQLQVRTLNALGLALVTGSEEVATIEEREVRSLLAALVDLPRKANTDPAASWLEALSAVRLGLRSPKEVEAEFGGDVDGLPEVFERYRRLLAERGQVDFDEQVYRAIEILLTDPDARRRARAGCRVMLVDEFQDLTPAHVLLVRLLAGPDGAVFGVGDDDQTIYGYSGASPEWLVGFRRFFPSAGQHALQVNYRCPPKVVEGARNLLVHNRHRVDKTILVAPGRTATGPELEVVAAGERALASTVATVEALLAGGAAPSDVAVLSRVNSSLAGVQVALVHREVPVQPAVDVTYLSRSGVQAALAWLRLASAPAGRLNGRDLAIAAKRPSRGLAPRVVEWMAEQPSIPKLKGLAGRLSPRDGDKVAAFLSDLELVRARAEAGTVAATLRAVRDQVGLDRAMELLDSSRRRLDRSAQTDDLDALVALAALHPASDGFEEWLRVSLRHPGSAGGVVLSTVHRVKGREWPHVVLHEVTDGLFPHRLAEDVEEERRVFHVGLTRCSVSVHLVTGDPPSPFVEELRGQSVPARRPEGGARRAATTTGHRPSTPRHDAQPPPEVVDRVRRSLRAWRSERAANERKPAFVFLHDRTLEALAQAAPANMTALARVQGIGPAKLDAYGDEWLALIAEAVASPPG